MLLYSFLFVCLLVVAASQTELEDMLRDTDRFFDALDVSLDEITRESEKFKLLMRRSYDLADDEHPLEKRSLDEKTELIRDEKGVFLIRDVKDFARVPAKFPTDIQIISAWNGGLLIAALESDEDLPQSKLANHLVLHRLEENGSWHELARTEVSGGYRLASYSFRNATYILSSEYDADWKTPFRGSSLYRILRYGEQVQFQKIQILNITHPKDIKLWEHQDQMYLGVGTSSDSDNKSYVLIFQWLGHNFDFIQRIAGNNVKSVTPFVIGSSMYLAVSNHEDNYGNTDTFSEIYRFNLQSKKFIPYQWLKTQAANDIAHFKFKDSKSKKEEHFIVVANHFEREYDGSRRYRTDSVVYKFEDDNFVPFQNFKLYRALQWVPITGSQDEFLLLAVCSYTVIGYQYDGWRFKEINLDYGQSPFGRNIASMRSFHHNGDMYLSVADKHNDGSAINLWKISFEHENLLEKKYSEVEKWCNDMRSKIESDDLDEKVKDLHAHFRDLDHKSLGVKMDLKNAEIDILETDSFDVYNATMIDDLNNLNRNVKELKTELKDLRERLEKAEFIIYYDVEGLDEIPYLELECPREECCSFENLNIGTLNSVDFLSFLNNAVSLNENIADSKLEFENLIVTHDMTPVEINSHPVETLIDTQTDLFLNSDLIVNGTVIIEGDLHIDDKYVPYLKTEEDILRENVETFTGGLVLEAARVKNLELSGKLNGIRVEKLFNETTSQPKNTFEKLSVQNLLVKGSILGFNTSDRDRSSIEAKEARDLEFDVLEVDSIFVETGIVSEVNISDMVLNTKGKYHKLEGGINFTQSVFEPNYLEVQESINGIPVEYFRKDNCTDISESDVIIVEGTAFVRDIVDPKGGNSILEILDNGILLNASIIDADLYFDEVKIDELHVESVNSVPVTSWILRDSDDVQFVRGKKIFLGNTHFESAAVKRINGIDLEELYEDTLFLDGEQTITGNTNFSEIKAARLNCDFISLDGEQLEPGQKNLKIIGSAVVNTLSAENLTLNGFMNSLSWENIIQDPLYTKSALNEDTEGESTDQGGTIPLESEEEIEEFTLSGDIILNATLHVDELTFEGSLDSVPKSRFGKEWLLSEGDQTIHGHIIFNDVKLNSGANLKNETINNINLRNLFENSLKVNESIHIKHLAVNNVVAGQVEIEGTVNGAKFHDSVLLAESDVPQIVQGEWFLDEDLIINGSLIIDGLVSGINLTHLCRLHHSEPEEINLVVGGSVRFTKEPRVLVDVNGVNLDEIAKEIWFKNEDVVLANGNKKFCQVELHGNANLKGYVNDVDLEKLSKNYFSKTSTKILQQNMKVRNLLIQKSCRIHSMTVGGKVNGIDLDEWSKRVLLQDEDQVITGEHHFYEFAADNIVLNGTVSGLDLAKGVLRYDVPNAVVTGEKTFLNLSVRNMTVAEGKRVQEVDVDDWARRAVRKNGNFTISANLTLHAPYFKSLNVSGTVNDLIFDSDHILLVSGNQTITGKKTFDLKNYPNETLRIRHLTAKGLVSGVDIDYLIENQAFNDQDLVFVGRKTFTGELTADYLTVNGLFQNEVITEICANLARPPVLEDFSGKYEKLLAKAEIINKYFKGEAFFLDYYEALQTLSEDVFAVLPYSYETEVFVSVITSGEMRILEWDSFADQFAFKEGEVLSLVNVTFATSVATKAGRYLYLEISNVSKIFGSGNSVELEIGGTSCVVPFELTYLNKSCFFIGQEWSESKIFCNSSVLNDLQTYQTLETLGAVHASALQVGEEVYIAVINKEKMVDKVENVLTVYKYDRDFQSFYVSSTLPEINPVAVSTITHKKHNFLALAGGHLPESVDTSIITIFRLSKENNVFVRYQSLLVDTPVDVHFAHLPTSELVLYVLSLNPTKPLIVFLYKGIQGFVEMTSGPSLYMGNKIDSFTNPEGEHFVFISGYGRGQILRAGFKGNRIG